MSDCRHPWDAFRFLLLSPAPHDLPRDRQPIFLTGTAFDTMMPIVPAKNCNRLLMEGS
jgi:hypothetical protein